MKRVLLKSTYAGYKPNRIISLEDQEANGVVSGGTGEYVVEGPENEGQPTEETESSVQTDEHQNDEDSDEKQSTKRKKKG